jgi:hypothetical protein
LAKKKARHILVSGFRGGCSLSAPTFSSPPRPVAMMTGRRKGIIRTIPLPQPAANFTFDPGRSRWRRRRWSIARWWRHGWTECPRRNVLRRRRAICRTRTLGSDCACYGADCQRPCGNPQCLPYAYATMTIMMVATTRGRRSARTRSHLGPPGPGCNQQPSDNQKYTDFLQISSSAILAFFSFYIYF